MCFWSFSIVVGDCVWEFINSGDLAENGFVKALLKGYFAESLEELFVRYSSSRFDHDDILEGLVNQMFQLQSIILVMST